MKFNRNITKIKWFLITILFVVVAQSCKQIIQTFQEADDNTDVIMLWQGFEHEWVDRVHRVGRLGNWIENGIYDGSRRASKLNHSAQSGIDADAGKYLMKYSAVQAAYTSFITKSCTFTLEGKERELLDGSEEIIINLDENANFSDKDRFVAIVNGFELYKTDKGTKKLGDLSIELSVPETKGNKIIFTIDVALKMSCSSIECSIDTNKMEYNLDVHWVLVGMNSDWATNVNHARLGINYEYDSDDGIVPESLGKLDYVEVTPEFLDDYDYKISCIRGFKINIEKESTTFTPDVIPHLYSLKLWGNGSPTYGGSINGLAFFEHRKEGVTNPGHEGDVNMDLYFSTLHFKYARIKNCTWKGREDFGNDSRGRTSVSHNGSIGKGTDCDCI